MVNETLRPRSLSHRSIAGNASLKSDVASDTTSLSVVERDVDVCRFANHMTGKKVLGPSRTRNPPLVERALPVSPAKSASTNSERFKSFGSSETKPVRNKSGYDECTK